MRKGQIDDVMDMLISVAIIVVAIIFLNYTTYATTASHQRILWQHEVAHTHTNFIVPYMQAPVSDALGYTHGDLLFFAQHVPSERGMMIEQFVESMSPALTAVHTDSLWGMQLALPEADVVIHGSSLYSEYPDAYTLPSADGNTVTLGLARWYA